LQILSARLSQQFAKGKFVLFQRLYDPVAFRVWHFSDGRAENTSKKLSLAFTDLLTALATR